MHKLVKIDFFGKEQTLYFNVLRLAELERALGKSILKIVAEQEVGVDFCCHALAIGLKHHDKKMSYLKAAEMLEDYFERGGDLNEIIMAGVKALMATGLFGKRSLENESEEQEGTEGKN